MKGNLHDVNIAGQKATKKKIAKNQKGKDNYGSKKKTSKHFEARAKYPPPPQTDTTERQTQPMQEKIQPGLDVSSDKYFPLLESAKSMEKNEKHEENKR